METAGQLLDSGDPACLARAPVNPDTGAMDYTSKTLDIGGGVNAGATLSGKDFTWP